MIWMQTTATQISAQQEAERLDELLSGIAAGNRDSLAQLYDRTRAAVYGLALSYMKNKSDAEDVAQDTYVQIWNCAKSFRPQGRPMAWLMTVTRNMALQQLRRKGREQTMEPEEWDQLPAPQGTGRTEDQELIHQLLSLLTAEESRIVTLHAVAGLKHREIAQLEDLPLATELSKYHRALKKLKNVMEGEDTQ